MPVDPEPVGPDLPLVICVIGIGPRGTSVLERLVANLDDLEGDRRVEVHLVDPFPPGAGRVWRDDQPALLWMNSTLADVTTFPDESVRCAGPVVGGPSLWEWTRDVARLLPADDPVGVEARRLGPLSFATRRLQSAYLRWVFDRVRASAPDRVRITVHPSRARDLTRDASSGRQLVWLDHEDVPLTADRVVLAQGHLDGGPTAEETTLATFARHHGLGYVSTGYTADLPLDQVPAGETVLVRGLGLAFVDYMVLLAEGRGGRFERRGGELTYLPSGREPLLVAGSGRGVPYHSKVAYAMGPPSAARFFTLEACRRLRTEHGSLDFWEHLFPLMCKEIGWAYYRELFTAHPERVNLTWADFSAKYAELSWEDHELTELVATSVPKHNDRLDFTSLDQPLSGRRFPDHEVFQDWMRDYISADIDRRADHYHSADGAAFVAMLVVYGTLAAVLAEGGVSARAEVVDIDRWWHGFFSYFASGPPGERLEELLALSRAGIVRFLGADMLVDSDPRGVFVGSSSSVPEPVEAHWLIEARLPRPDVTRTTDTVVRNLLARGAATEHVLTDPSGRHWHSGKLRVRRSDFRIIRPDGTPDPDRFAAGYWVAGAIGAGAFPRPRLNAPFFRQNDALARAALGISESS
ncbi:FAD/NAD(P)-binding protein [Actinopolymorpha pittospori]